MMWVRLENFQTFGIDLLLPRYLQSLAILLNLIAFTGFKKPFYLKLELTIWF